MRYDLYINGQWVSAPDTFEVINPRTGETAAVCADGRAAHGFDAVNSAHAAAGAMAALSVQQRVEILREIAAAIRAGAKRLAGLVALETGKPQLEAAGEIVYGLSYFTYYADLLEQQGLPSRDTTSGGNQITVRQRPVGVSGFITPWNFPFALIARKVAPALAAGCPVVMKPSELAPLGTVGLCEILHEVSLPTGAVNMVSTTLAGEVVDSWIDSGRLRKLSFTGSSAVASQLAAKSGAAFIRYSHEAGGNAPFIVCEDADIDRACAGLIAAKLRNSGQVCIAANRILVHSQVYTQFMNALVEKLSSYSTSKASGQRGELGPMISPDAAVKLQRKVDEAIAEGAVVRVAGGRDGEGSSYFSPVVLENVAPESSVWAEELFGPVICVASFDSDEQAISEGNNVPAGLVAYVFSENAQRIDTYTTSLDVGMVGVNTGVISSAAIPFGGVKHSGCGREGGPEGLTEFTETIAVSRPAEDR